MKISACYIVKNEELTLGKSIDSIKGCYDELIVVDTGSTDRTVEVAKEKGAEVYFFSWQDDFSKARNFALSILKGDWVIFLDADEIYCSSVNIKDYILSNGEGVDAFLMNSYQVEKRNLPPLKIARIFRNDDNIRYTGAIHEVISRLNGKLRIYDATNSLYVETTGYNADVMPRKLKRNLDLILKDISVNGEQDKYYYYLAECYFGQKKYAEALEYIKKAIASPVRHLFEEANYYHILIESMRQCEENIDEIEKMSDKAIRLFPEMPEFYGEKGIILSSKGDFDEALNMLAICAEKYESEKRTDLEFGYLTDSSMDIIYDRMMKICLIKEMPLMFELVSGIVEERKGENSFRKEIRDLELEYQQCLDDIGRNIYRQMEMKHSPKLSKLKSHTIDILRVKSILERTAIMTDEEQKIYAEFTDQDMRQRAIMEIEKVLGAISWLWGRLLKLELALLKDIPAPLLNDNVVIIARILEKKRSGCIKNG